MSGAGQAKRVLLAATAIEETWLSPDDFDELVFLAPWCRRYSRRDVWQPLGVDTVGDPWAEPGDLAKGISRVRTITDSVLSELTHSLSAVHDERWSARYTQTMLGPWLLFYVSAQVDRWERLAGACARYPTLMSVGAPDSVAFVPSDTLETVRGLMDDFYNLQLMKPMMQGLGIEIVTAPTLASASRPPLAQCHSTRGTLRTVAGAISKAALSLHGGRGVAFTSSYFPREAQLGLAAKSRLMAVPMYSSSIPLRADVDSEYRSRIRPLNLGGGAFERHLAAAIIRDLPTCYLEGYRGLRETAGRIGVPPAGILSANAWYFDEPFKCWSARASNAGSRLLGVQHGGNYGIDEYAPSEDHELAITDRYYTWGWSREDCNAETRPMPASKLVGCSDMSPVARVAEGVLLVATVTPTYSIQLDHGPERFERYMARQHTFLSALSPQLASLLRVRPHRESMGWDYCDRVRDAHPGIRIESWDVDFTESLAACRVFVCDHLSTTFAEALAANKPTILFWDTTRTRVRSSAAGVFAELETAGILHDSPEAAAEALSEAYEDVVLWWGEPARVAAVASFREQFARTDQDAIQLWADELRSVVRQR